MSKADRTRRRHEYASSESRNHFSKRNAFRRRLQFEPLEDRRLLSVFR